MVEGPVKKGPWEREEVNSPILVPGHNSLDTSARASNYHSCPEFISPMTSAASRRVGLYP